MKIKTRDSLKTIKTFDRAETLAQKSKSGVSSLHNSAEQTQNVGYESETDYAGSELQGKEERFGRAAVVGANRVGKWGVRETRKNIDRWRNRLKKPKPNPNLKQLPSPRRAALQAPKKGVKSASKGAQNATKASVRAAQAAKRAAIATANFVKAAIKAIIAAAKATVAAVKGIIAAIAAGGWIVVLIIVIVVIVGLVVGSVFSIFTPADDNGITIYSVRTDIEREYHQRQGELVMDQTYDVLVYEGDLAPWADVIAVYAVKLNLDYDNPQEVATFDEKKADKLREIFWDMHELSVRSETRVIYVTHQEMDDDGNVTEVTEEISLVYLIVVTSSKSAEQMATKYGFNSKQYEMLAALLSAENAELWAGILGE